MCVGTAASMDGFTAYGASITKDGNKLTFDCPAPLGFVMDSVFAAAAPKELAASGYADLSEKIRQQIIPFSQVRKNLQLVGAPYEPEMIGVSRERFRQTVSYIPYMRSRFTNIDVIYRLGWMDEFIERMFGKGGIWKYNQIPPFLFSAVNQEFPEFLYVADDKVWRIELRSRIVPSVFRHLFCGFQGCLTGENQHTERTGIMGHCGIRIYTVSYHRDFFRLESMSVKNSFEHIWVRLSESYIRLTASRMLDTFAYRSTINKNNFLVGRTYAVRIGRDIRYTL